MANRSVQDLNTLIASGHYHKDNPNLPVEYITGTAEFYGNRFVVNASTLIPRLETEKIIDLAASYLTEWDMDNSVIADVGTGSGIIGLTLALHPCLLTKQSTILLSDISKEALQVAQNNYRLLAPKIPKSITVSFIASDLTASYPATQLNLIVANLPYVPTSRVKQLDCLVQKEPRIALDGGQSGTQVIQRLINEITRIAGSPFAAVLEIDDTHELTSFTVPHGFLGKITQDIFAKNRYLTLTKRRG